MHGQTLLDFINDSPRHVAGISGIPNWAPNDQVVRTVYDCIAGRNRTLVVICWCAFGTNSRADNDWLVSELTAEMSNRIPRGNQPVTAGFNGLAPTP